MCHIFQLRNAEWDETEAQQKQPAINSKHVRHHHFFIIIIYFAQTEHY